MKDIVAVITARGGSVRVPKKNIRLLGGKPLIVWVIEAAIKSNCTRVIVSTDSDEISNISISAGAEVPFKRPEEISKNIASELVTQHAIKFHEDEKDTKVDLAVTIQPTTPFLKTSDINNAIKMIKDNSSLDSVFTAAPIHQRPEWMFNIDEKSSIAENIFNKKIRGKLGISQNLPDIWHPNGGAYVTRRKTLFEMNTLIGDKPGILKMDNLNSVDIDEEIDFIIADSILKYKESKLI